MTTLAYSDKHGITILRPDGTQGFMPEPESEWYKTCISVSKFTKPPTAYRAGKYFGINPRTIRVVRTLGELTPAQREG